MATTGTGYGFDGSGVSLWKVSAWSTLTQVATSSMAVTTGQPHRIEVHLASIELWWDGVRVLQASKQLPDDLNVARHRRFDALGWDLDVRQLFDRGASASAIAQVAVTPTSSTVALGGFDTFSALAFDASNNVIPNVPFTGPSRRRVRNS